ncbi:DUF4013 domain-containing protein [Halopenitus sp. H-Gu1]|uniref:DUF4013 domain-containing protein n=1 Tax=Halopenitus sp. H-Gu1 TaxID=3242697 RepID=UPI00359DC5D6
MVERYAKYPISDTAGTQLLALVLASLFATMGVLQLGIAVLFPVAIIPAMVGIGVIARVLTESAVGEKTPPAIEQASTLVGAGLRGTTVVAASAIIPVLTLLGGQRVLLALGTTGGSDGGILLFVVSVTILSVVAFFAYLAPIAIAHVGESTSARQTFDSRISTIASRTEYLVAWGSSGIALLGVGGLIALMRANGGPIGDLLGIAILGYAILAWAHAVGWAIGIAKRRSNS